MNSGNEESGSGSGSSIQTRGIDGKIQQESKNVNDTLKQTEVQIRKEGIATTSSISAHTSPRDDQQDVNKEDKVLSLSLQNHQLMTMSDGMENATKMENMNQMCVMKEKAETKGPPMMVDEIFDTILPPRLGYAGGCGPGPKPPSQA
ncbi:hypothetical protein FNV43_RR05810 [Rhamnella rubrinervis]|uniref:Uncharacterized protein n=1 Tax=Rhamnella rubrinervis TaxID=2594499 RepID=A0A8K0MRG9_9ROSA|nr:hypothetical protein FNV43_RR05810 [Rhamnella rubrinervis]